MVVARCRGSRKVSRLKANVCAKTLHASHVRLSEYAELLTDEVRDSRPLSVIHRVAPTHLPTSFESV